MPRKSRSLTRTLFAVALVVAAGIGALWFAALMENQDRTRAALIAASSALTAGYLAALSNLMITSINSKEQRDRDTEMQRIELRNLRRVTYTRLIESVSAYSEHRTNARMWGDHAANASGQGQNDLKERSLNHFNLAEQFRPQVVSSIAAAEFVAGEESKSEIRRMHEAFLRLGKTKITASFELPWRDLQEVLADEVGDTTTQGGLVRSLETPPTGSRRTAT